MDTERPPLGPDAKSLERLSITGLILLGWALIVVLRLCDLQVFAHDRYVKLAESQQDKLILVDAPRGAIFDRNGVYLALTSHGSLVAVNPAQIASPGVAAGLLARLLDLDANRLENEIETAQRSKRHHGYLIVARQIPDEQARELAAMKLNWIIIGDDQLRSYPNHELAAHVVGNVNAENQGVSGVERRFNKDLAGTPGWTRIKVDVARRAYDAEIATAAVPGKSIGLTIDSDVQHIAEEALRQSVTENHATRGSLVAIDPKTGEILALANYPTYDPNQRLKPGAKPYGREDFAVEAPYEPGSVFKVITLSAALETTNLKPETIIPCAGGVLHIFGRTIHDAEGHGDLSMADVLAKSSNVGAIRIGMQVGATNMYDYVRRFGVGHRTGIDLPAESAGMLRPLRRWQATSLASISFGHEVSVTAVQLARIGCVFANGGFLVHPHVVAWKQAPGEKKRYVSYPEPAQVIKPETVMTMRMLMHRVVMPGGTASRLHVVGYSLAGKTGTAQIFDFAHHVYTHKYNASFVGFAPLTNPSIVIAVTVSGTTGTAGFGSAAAGPVFQTVMAAALRRFDVPRDVPEELEELAEKEKPAVNAKETPREGDDVSLAELDPPTAEELEAAADADPDAPKAPNFVGKTVKGAMQEAASEGVALEMFGDGLARAQSPAAGAVLSPGEKIQVRFTR